MLASHNGHTKVTKLLLDHNAQDDLQEKDGWSALMLASHNGHAEVAKLQCGGHLPTVWGQGAGGYGGYGWWVW